MRFCVTWRRVRCAAPIWPRGVPFVRPYNERFTHTRGLDPSPEFMAHLRTTLRDAARTVRAPRGIRFRGWWALAATVLLAIALGFAYRWP